MASSRNRSTSKRASSSKAGSRKAKVEVVEEAGDESFGTGIAILTTVMLIVAFFVLDMELGEHYGKGALFTDSYSAAK